jgi:hypothetical protein
MAHDVCLKKRKNRNLIIKLIYNFVVNAGNLLNFFSLYDIFEVWDCEILASILVATPSLLTVVTLWCNFLIVSASL